MYIKLTLFTVLLSYSSATRTSTKRALRGRRHRRGRQLQAIPQPCMNEVVSEMQGFEIEGCDVFALYDFIDPIVMDSGACEDVFPEEVLANMLGVQRMEEEAFEAAMKSVCAPAKAAFDKTSTTDFFSLTDQPAKWYEDFYDGNTYLNEHVDNDDGTTLLQNEGSYIDTFYENVALKGPVSFPNNLDQFQNCEDDMEAVMCCWVQDRQEDDNGNCASDPYSENCRDADPDANTDLCYVDYSNAPQSSRVSGGFAIFDNSIEGGEEGEAHCHGFAWTGNSADDITRYRGNNLFYVSFYDHLFVRGYVRQVPGASMCGCMKQLPVATRSDCTQVDVLETFELTYSVANGFTAKITNAEVEFNACEAEEEDNDLAAYWREIHRDDSAEAAKIDKYLVGEGEGEEEEDTCRAAITSFLSTKAITRSFI